MSAEQAETTAMPGGIERLRGQLHDAVELVRRSGGGVVFERFPGALQDEPLSDGVIDGVAADRGPVATDGAATAHRGLVDAVDDLAETIAELERTAWRTSSLRAAPGTP